MVDTKLGLSLRFYGISPWELEVLYSLFNSLFLVEEHPEENQDSEFTTLLDIVIPVAFNDEFFKWFGISRWDKMKAILKELKRRRGGGKTVQAYIKFKGRPNIKFYIDLEDRKLFDLAIEKIDFVRELLPYHLDPQRLPNNITEILYHFDDSTGRWSISSGMAVDEMYQFSEGGWKVI